MNRSIESTLTSIEQNYTPIQSSISQRGIYFLYNAQIVVYVGQGENVFQRISFHPEKVFDAYSYFLADANENLNNLEAFFIARFTPRYNRHLPPNDLFYTYTHIRQLLRLGRNTAKELKIRNVGPSFYLHENPFYSTCEIAEKFPDLNGALNIAAVGGIVTCPGYPPLSCSLSLGASEAAG